MREYHFVCDGPPSHDAGRFVELEDESGKSINPGRWKQVGSLWHLIVPAPDVQQAPEPKLIGMDFRVGIRPDGELTRVTISQADVEILLTQAQAEALAGQINARFK